MYKYKPFPECVKDFMEIAHAKQHGLNLRGLYFDLITEEYKELVEAIAERDILKVLDAVCDLDWVTAGYYYASGRDAHSITTYPGTHWLISIAANAANDLTLLKTLQYEYMQEVIRSNFDKTTMPRYADNGKLLKPDDWIPPQCDKLLALADIIQWNWGAAWSLLSASAPRIQDIKL